MSHAHITPDDPRLTAFVLGELEPAEAAEVERAVAQSPELREAVAELRATTADLFAALQCEPVPGGGIELPAPRAAAVTVAAPDGGLAAHLKCAAKPPSAASPSRRGRFLLVNAVTLLLLIGVIISLQGGPRSSPGNRSLDGLAKLSPEELARVDHLRALDEQVAMWRVDNRNSPADLKSLEDEFEAARQDWLLERKLQSEREVPALHASDDDRLRLQPPSRGVTLDETEIPNLRQEKFLFSEGIAGGTANQPGLGDGNSYFGTDGALRFSGAIPSTVAPGTAGGNGVYGDFLPSDREQSGGKPTSGRDSTVRLDELTEQGQTMRQAVRARILQSQPGQPGGQPEADPLLRGGQSQSGHGQPQLGGARSEAERLSARQQGQMGGGQQRGSVPTQLYLLPAESQPQAGQPDGFGVVANQPVDAYDALGVAGPQGGQPGDVSQSQNSSGGAGQLPTTALRSHTMRNITSGAAIDPTTAGTPLGFPQNGQAPSGAVGFYPVPNGGSAPARVDPRYGRPERNVAGLIGDGESSREKSATLYDYDNTAVAEDLVQFGVPATADPQQPQPYSFYTLKSPEAFFEWRSAQLSWDDGAWSEVELQQAKDQLARHWNFQPQQLAELQKLSESEVRELARGGRGEYPWPAYLPYLGTEAYAPVDENEFTVPAGEQALSTFSLDVDTASYSNVRRFLTEQQLPPPAAVRLEELVNYFDYSLPQPEGDDPFSVTLEATSCPWNPQHRLVRIGLQGREIDMAKRPLTRLVFLLDVSGSMSDANKLPLVKDSMKLLVEQLGENDRIAIVTYSDTAELKLDSTAGSDKAAILAAIDSLSAGGSTNGAGGIQLAYETATKQFLKDASNRVILCTDGDFNVGVSSDDELVKLIEEKRQSGVFLSIFGYGMGNLKDAKLEGLANKGNGHYGYIDDLDEARKVFIEELTGMLYTIAKDVKLQVEFNPAKVAAYRLLGYENRTLAAEDFNNDKVDAGEMGAGHTVTALYELVPNGPWSPPVKESRPAVDALKYQPSAVSGQQSEVESPEPSVQSDALANAVAGSESPRANQALAEELAKRLRTAGVHGFDISIVVRDGQATVTGRVDNEEVRTKIDDAAREVPGLTVSNRVVVAGGPQSGNTSAFNSQPSTLSSSELLTVKLRYKQPTGDESVKREFPLADEPRRCSEDLQFAAAVTGFGMLLRNSQYGAGVNWDLVIELAEGAKGDDESGRRGEFIDLARQARRLWQAAYPHGSPAEWRQRLTSLAADNPSPAPSIAEEPTNARQALVNEVSGKYAVVSLGSSHGVRDGQTFDVLRKSAQQQQPGAKTIEYLGQLRIIDVNAETSVGEFMPLKQGVTLAIGDAVVSEL